MSPQDAALHRTPAAPAGTGEDGLPPVCRLCAPPLPALGSLPPAAAVPEALLALLRHLPPAALLPSAAKAQLAVGPPGHGVCRGPVGWEGQSGSQVFSEDDGLLASRISPRTGLEPCTDPLYRIRVRLRLGVGVGWEAGYPRSHSWDEAGLTPQFSLSFQAIAVPFI